MTERVIYDCDNTMGLPRKEIDDGLTLLYLLGRPDVELLGVTTTFGNGTIGEVYPQTIELLRGLGCSDVPVFEGEGRRGQAPTGAARFLVDRAARSPGEITLLATGPLGNLRAAAEIDPCFFPNLKQVVCMGGYLRPLRIGWRDVRELNLSANPEAAHSVLNASCPVTVMNAHVCLQAPFGWGDLRRVAFWDREMCRVVRNWLLAFGVYCGVPVFYLWDLLPAVYITHPDLFDDNPVEVRSTVADLETGTLVVADGSEDGTTLLPPVRGGRINMPASILDGEQFRRTVFDAWRQSAPRVRGGHRYGRKTIQE